MAYRGRLFGLCPSKTVRAEELENTIWNDSLGFLNDPGSILDQLTTHLDSRQEQVRDLEQERVSQSLMMSHKEDEKERILDLYRHGHINIADLERQLEKIAQEEAALKSRIVSLETMLKGLEAIASRLLEAHNLLYTLRQRLKEEFVWEEKRDIVEALVLEVRVDTIGEGKEKESNITVTYAFDGGVANRKDRCAVSHHGETTA
jgi:site-specific DNA recombinase